MDNIKSDDEIDFINKIADEVMKRIEQNQRINQIAQIVMKMLYDNKTNIQKHNMMNNNIEKEHTNE
jgi:hypothetical protein